MCMDCLVVLGNCSAVRVTRGEEFVLGSEEVLVCGLVCVALETDSVVDRPCLGEGERSNQCSVQGSAGGASENVAGDVSVQGSAGGASENVAGDGASDGASGEEADVIQSLLPTGYSPNVGGEESADAEAAGDVCID